MVLSPFERAKTEYWVKQKVTAKRSERGGQRVGMQRLNLLACLWLI